MAFNEASFEHHVTPDELDRQEVERVYRVKDPSGPLQMAFRKNSDPDLIARFREGFEAITRNGTRDTTPARHLRSQFSTNGCRNYRRALLISTL
ncbi:hypothetical protein JM93_04070 [Roseibium hamelinense]|uniref:Uncharacterized protein n=1 Tax=Roseibium hamelinense TaxID=150831 RepID=A0A562SFD7_9HYPH|nr:hypothetical protein JM93_04070 [Roseibium hamelinense]